jgi:hypothetical protein
VGDGRRRVGRSAAPPGVVCVKNVAVLGRSQDKSDRLLVDQYNGPPSGLSWELGEEW